MLPSLSGLRQSADATESTGSLSTKLPALLSSSAGLWFSSAVIVYATWWLWTFMIRPTLNPHEPKQYPYFIPFVGHAIAFSKDSDRTFTQARQYFGNTREPFAITVAGQVFYVITSSEDTNLIYRNTKTLTFDEFVQDMLQTLGLSQQSLRNAFPTESGARPLTHYAQEIYRTQFLPGHHLYTLWSTIHANIQSIMIFDNIPKEAILDSSGNVKRLSLWRWARATLITAITQSIFGKALLELEPKLVEIFAAFDDNSWKLTYKYPKSAAKDMHTALERLAAMFKAYRELPAEKRADAAWAIPTIEAKFHEFGLTDQDIALAFVMPLWVINSNAYKLCFWMLALILQDSALREVISEEVADALVADPNDSGNRLEQCHRLVAVYYEVLRVNTSSASIRGIAADTEIGSVVLRAGNKVMVPYRQLHMNESVWGSDVSKFRFDRFAAQDLAKSPSFRPFGGGNTYCTGRHVAMREVLTFVALALHRLDVDVPTDASRSTERVMGMVDQAMPTLGVLPPLPGKDVEVTVKRG